MRKIYLLFAVSLLGSFQMNQAWWWDKPLQFNRGNNHVPPVRLIQPWMRQTDAQVIVSNDPYIQFRQHWYKVGEQIYYPGFVTGFLLGHIPLLPFLYSKEQDELKNHWLFLTACAGGLTLGLYMDVVLPYNRQNIGFLPLTDYTDYIVKRLGSAVIQGSVFGFYSQIAIAVACFHLKVPKLEIKD